MTKPDAIQKRVPNFRQKYGTVSGPGSMRREIRLAPRAARMLRQLADDGKRSGAIAVAVETLFAVMLGTPSEIEECAETLAGLLALDAEGPRVLRRWADGARMLADLLDAEAVKMAEAMVEEAAGE